MIFGKQKQVYLDNAATTPVDEKVLKVMLPYFSDKFGNASSLHYPGEEARRAVEESREVIAKSIGGKYKEIIFTSGGTESNNLTIKGLFFHFNKEGKNHIIISKIEHDCVLNACKWLEKQGADVTYLNVDKEGFVNPEDVKKAITNKTFLVSIIHGNNEVGTIQDLEAIGKIIKEKSKEILFHTDACQSFTKTNIDVKKMNLDLATLNAHKIYGPKGIGALYIREDLKKKINPLFSGGGHEFGVRSGTENVPGIVGFAKASGLTGKSEIKKMTHLRDYLIDKILKIPDTSLNGPRGEKRLCNNINISFKNIEGEAIGGYLNAKGISTSTGSACSSKSLEPSHVLKAMGLSAVVANTSIRITLSKNNTQEEVDYALEEIKRTVEILRKMSPLV
ncbi:cysteine desulfurase NifS [Candidatus Amesbacteria bacterium RIFOXYD1_FULL_47_9]|uniref:Cysteine desulfurase NifS n=1 Tax=Candidatus Amesbacteria bacterium RIFOXYD1_FULL_47_9 TaxID=1797267 RepID=A0A1F4ZY02_9BACT|nr:MAG: cysteine desulfurase NifS [Candidatus Amesbacteria bacterium RIFOXYD1_FULL_47_9]